MGNPVAARTGVINDLLLGKAMSESQARLKHVAVLAKSKPWHQTKQRAKPRPQERARGCGIHSWRSEEAQQNGAIRTSRSQIGKKPPPSLAPEHVRVAAPANHHAINRSPRKRVG